MTTSIRIGLLGFGNVGSQVYGLLRDNAGLLATRLRRPLELARIGVRDLSKRRSAPASLFTSDIKAVVSDPDIAVVVEVMGDRPEAYEAMAAALENGKHVVTANKAVIARRGPELFAIAERKGVNILFEASVGGGIPILRVLREGLCADRILKLRGIINGTCNHILSEMEGKGVDFGAALKNAQRLGLAEADPSSDIDGLDAAAKLSILVMLCYGVRVPAEKIPAEGIRDVAPIDFAMARRFGYAVKLLGIAGRDAKSGIIEARVHPVLVRHDDPIAHVGGACNAIQYAGVFSGVGMAYGEGAGGRPTASAIVSDLVEIANDLDRPGPRLSPAGCTLASLKEEAPADMGDFVCPYYLRFAVADRPSVLAKIAAVLGRRGISIRHVYQHGEAEESREATVIAFTHRSREKDVRAAIAEIDKLESTLSTTRLIRIEEDL